MPFRPAGEIAQWRIVYDLFRVTAVGETISYRVLGETLSLDPVRGRHKIQAAARRAAKQLLARDDRAVETVPQVGYRIAPAERHIPMAGQQVERASKALDRGRELTTHVRLDELGEPERQIVHGMAVMLAQVGEFARQITRRVETHENRLDDIEKELRRLREERGGE